MAATTALCDMKTQTAAAAPKTGKSSRAFKPATEPVKPARAPKPDRLLRLAKVIEMTGASKAWIYREMQQGRFVQQIKLAPKISVWSERAVIEWINARTGAAQ